MQSSELGTVLPENFQREAQRQLCVWTAAHGDQHAAGRARNGTAHDRNITRSLRQYHHPE